MNILGFDTSQSKTYISLMVDSVIKESMVIENKGEKYHSAFLLPNLVEILKNNNLSPNDIDLIATNIGPGSFTGIRACGTVARVFAQALDLKTVGISSLEIFARMKTLPHKVLTLMDARKEKAYIAVYKESECLYEPGLIELEKLEEFINSDNFVILADKKMCEFLLQKGIMTSNYGDFEENLADVIVRIANERAQKNQAQNWADLKALYIQPPPITMPKLTQN